MKAKYILAASLVTLLSTNTNAQVMAVREPIVNMAVKVGGNYMTLASAPVKGGFAPMAGVYAWKNIGRFGIRLEAMGSMVTYTTKYAASFYSIYSPGMDTVTKAQFDVINVSAPLLIEYQLTERMQIMAGPQFSYAVTVTDKNEAYTKIYGNSDFIKKTDVAIVAGADYAVDFRKRLRVGARVMAGVTNINDNTYYLVPRTWTSFGVQLAVAYKIM